MNEQILGSAKRDKNSKNKSKVIIYAVYLAIFLTKVCC